MKFRDSDSLVRGWMERLVVIQLGGRAMRNAMDKLCARDRSAMSTNYDWEIKSEAYYAGSAVCLAIFAGTMKDFLVEVPLTWQGSAQAEVHETGYVPRYLQFKQVWSRRWQRFCVVSQVVLLISLQKEEEGNWWIVRELRFGEAANDFSTSNDRMISNGKRSRSFYYLQAYCIRQQATGIRHHTAAYGPQLN